MLIGSDQLPAEASHFTNVTREFKANPKRFVTDVIGSAVMAILSVPVSAVGFFVPPPDRTVVMIFGLTFGAFLAFAAFNVLRRSLREKNGRVLVYPQGLIFRFGSTTEVFPWDEFEFVWREITKLYINGVYAGTTHSYKWKLQGGREGKVDDAIKSVSDLGEIIEQEVTRRQLPIALNIFHAGQTVSFSPLEVSRQGLNNGKTTLAWQDVKSVRVESGQILVKKQGKWLPWCSVNVSQIPNVFVFCSLVDAIIHSESATSPLK